MNRTLLLLNALALAVLVGLILQPDNSEVSAQAQTPSVMSPRLVDFGNRAGSTPAPSEQAGSEQRLIF
ncbi:hypothetical protein [Pseudomonas sp. H9]|uniref:hypothetical protein n=1 Tax=Pseudomonas sp. H9 TaxID=483968 RepID=UPI00105788E0|nr:hypothetical protein [Pseudomonas sp. H9]TDF77550.1 hypothetical protein E1573_25680 [Pseudomonas sp. H9]